MRVTDDALVPINSNGWICAHIHVANASLSTLDHCVATLVAPVIATGQAEGWLRRSFFIRYGEGGPHIRLRIEPTSEVHTSRIRETISDMVLRFNKHSGKIHSWLLRWAEYSPETGRYGGVYALPIAEDFFCQSSTVVLMLLEGFTTKAWSHSHRLGQGLLLMVVMAHAAALNANAASSLLSTYGFSYLRVFAKDAAAQTWYDGVMHAFHEQEATLVTYVQEAWMRLRAGEQLSPALDRYGVAAKAYVQALGEVQVDGPFLNDTHSKPSRGAMLRHCLPSLIHMTSNRLGIHIGEEISLALLAHKALGALSPTKVTT